MTLSLKQLRHVGFMAGLALILSLPTIVRPQAREIMLPRPLQHINDLAGVVESATGARLENVLANLQERTGINFVVVTLKNVGSQDLYDYSMEAANKWDIGSQSNAEKSLLLVVTTDKLKFYSLPSRGLQAHLPNGVIWAMGGRMRPAFERGNYAAGLATGLECFIDILGQDSNFTFATLDTPRTKLSAMLTTPAPLPITKTVFQKDAQARISSTIAAANLPAKSNERTSAPAESTETVRSGAAPTKSAGRTPFIVPPEKAGPIQVPRLKTRPVIDGVLDDSAWSNAAVLRDFYQVQPGDNLAPSQPTEVLLGRDDSFLYVAFRAHDRSGKVRATIARRDQIFDDDTVGIYLDTFNDRRRAYKLFFNPLGIQADAILTEGQSADATVDIVMESKGVVTNDGYTVEVAIPFKSLRYESGAGKLWGVNFERHIKYPNDEVDSWMPISRETSGYLNQEGHLGGLDGISTARTLEIIPTLTVSERGRMVSANNPALPDETRLVNHPNFHPGVTLKYGVRPNVTASLTLNPDFADVEADQPVITANQRFPIFFSEKRPFFLEGIDVFRTPLQVVHTRTIVEPDVAAKLTGKVGRNSFGLLLASDAAPGNFSGDERNDPRIAKFVDKNAYVAVLRLKRDFGQQSSLGMIATSYNFIENHNELGGVDGRLRLDPQTVLSFQVVGTTARRHFYDPVLDKSVYRTGNGLGYSWSYEKSKRHLYFGLNGEGRTRDYVADVGFTRRTNTNYEDLYLSYSSEPNPSARLLSWAVSNSLSTNFDWQGRSQNWDNYSQLQLNFKWQTYFNIGYDEGYERLFEEEFGTKRTATRPGAFFGNDSERSTGKRSVSFSGGTTPRQKYSIYAFFGHTWNAFDYDFGAGPRFGRVSPAALVAPGAPLDPGAGNSTDMSVYFSYQPLPSWRSSFSYTRSRLVRNDTGRIAFADEIYSLHTEYHIGRFVFVRGRLDYDWLAANIFGQALFGWTPNPGTSFYVGYDDYLNYNGFNPVTGNFVRGFQRNQRVFFVKVSYLFRRSF